MRKLRLKKFRLLGLLLALTVSVCAAPTTVQQNADGVRRITKEELSNLLNDKKAKLIVVDVRSKDAYNNGHIKGAINIPWSELADNLKRLPKNDTLIVTYCS